MAGNGKKHNSKHPEFDTSLKLLVLVQWLDGERVGN